MTYYSVLAIPNAEVNRFAFTSPTSPVKSFTLMRASFASTRCTALNTVDPTFGSIFAPIPRNLSRLAPRLAPPVYHHLKM